MNTFYLEDYGYENDKYDNTEQADRNLVVAAALELLKAETQNAEVRINDNSGKNLVKEYADQIEEALKVEDA